jgi:hypothetical protein
MENAVYRLRPGTLKETVQGLIDRELRADWPGYSYREIQGSPYYKSLQDLVPIEDEAAKILAKKYLVPLLDNNDLSLSSENESRLTTETKKTFRSCGRSKRSL